MPQTSVEKRTRLLSLDVYRGLTVAGMILVTDPGTYGAVYRPLQHAEWRGATLTDMIMPSFLFMTGFAAVYSLAGTTLRGAGKGALLLRSLRRSVLLIALGLLLNGFPLFQWQTLRLPGILQRIAICYLFCSAVYVMGWRPGEQAGVDDAGKEGFPGRLKEVVRTCLPVALSLLPLVGYWALLRWVPVPGFGAGRLDTQGSLPAYVDRAVFGLPHMWPYGTTPGVGVTYDPDGLLSTVPALATALLGMVTAGWTRSERSGWSKTALAAMFGVVLITLGLLLWPVMPPVKKIWTPTFGLLCSGFSLVAFAVLFYVVDVRQWRRWTGPTLVFGTNALAAFVTSTVITTLLDRMRAANGQKLHQWGYEMALRTGLAPVNASLLYALIIVGANFVLLYPLYRRRIFLRF